MEDERNMQDQLFAAIKEEDIEEVSCILSNHPELINVKRRDELEQAITTPLMEACRAGGSIIIKYTVFSRIIRPSTFLTLNQ